MQVSQQTRTPKTRVQKKHEKMAAKKLAKETGIPLPKPSRIPKQRKKPAEAPLRVEKPKTAIATPSIARTHIELHRLMEEEKQSLLTPNDIDYPERPAYEAEFYVSSNLKYLDTTLEFPDEKVTFLDPKRCCGDLCKMLSDIGYKAIAARIKTQTERSLRIFIYEKDQNPLFRYFETEKQPNILEHRSVRTMNATLTLDIFLVDEYNVKLYLTNIDGNRISVGSYNLDTSMIALDITDGSVAFAKDIEYTMRCALCIAKEGRLYKLSKEYFEGDIIAMFLPARLIG